MKKDYDEYFREFDLVSECVDLHTAYDPQFGEITFGTPSKAKLLKERKRLAAIGRQGLAGFRRFLVEQLGLAEHTADQTVARLFVAAYETQGRPWMKLRIRSVSYSYKRALHSELRKWASYLTDFGTAELDADQEELINSLLESPFWSGGDIEDLIYGYSQRLRRRAKLPPLQQRPATLLDEEDASEVGDPVPPVHVEVIAALPAEEAQPTPFALPPHEEAFDAGKPLSDGDAEPLESPSVNAEPRDAPRPRRSRFDHRRADAQDAAAGAAQAIAPPVKAERRLIVDGEEAVPSPVAARMIGIQPQSLRAWRLRGIGPEYVRLGEGTGARVAYKVSVIERWIAEHSFRSTAEETMNTPRKR